MGLVEVKHDFNCEKKSCADIRMMEFFFISFVFSQTF